VERLRRTAKISVKITEKYDRNSIHVHPEYKPRGSVLRSVFPNASHVFHVLDILNVIHSKKTRRTKSRADSGVGCYRSSLHVTSIITGRGEDKN
jgi:hypothetical protein